MLIIVFFFYSPVWGKKTSMSDEVKVDAKEENGSTETESKPKLWMMKSKTWDHQMLWNKKLFDKLR